MKKKFLTLPLMVATLGLASCNNSAASISLSRVKYDIATEKEVQETFSKIKSSQYQEEKTTLYNKGYLTFRRSISAKGSFREDEISFHNINLSASSGFDISWSFNDRYMKVEGENETIYFIANEAGDDIIRYFKSVTHGKEYKFKHSVKDEMAMVGCDNYKDYFINLIDYYTTTLVPTFVSINGGITGENYYKSILASYCVRPDDLFGETLSKKVAELAAAYKDNTEGYNASLTYGKKNDKTISVNLKGKALSKDLLHDKFQTGYLNFDNFVAYENNFIKQVEYKIDGNISSYRDVNTNFDINLHIAEDVTEGKCDVDTINPSEYKDDSNN